MSSCENCGAGFNLAGICDHCGTVGKLTIAFKKLTEFTKHLIPVGSNVDANSARKATRINRHNLDVRRQNDVTWDKLSVSVYRIDKLIASACNNERHPIESSVTVEDGIADDKGSCPSSRTRGAYNKHYVDALKQHYKKLGFHVSENYGEVSINSAPPVPYLKSITISW